MCKAMVCPLEHVDRFEQRRILRMDVSINLAFASVTYKLPYQLGFHHCVVGKECRCHVTKSVKDSSLVALEDIMLCLLKTPVKPTRTTDRYSRLRVPLHHLPLGCPVPGPGMS